VPEIEAASRYLAGVARASAEQDEFRLRADRGVLVLYATVVESLGWATAALLDQDIELANRVIADDKKVDDKCSDLTDLIKDRLSEATVDPDELEDLITILQMVPELERSADLAEHIAQRTRQDLGGSISPRSRGLIQSMCDIGIRMWQLSSRAYAERSRDLSFEISEADDELDNLSAALLSEGAAGGVDPKVAAELALVARFYERLGDHAVNLARRSAAMAAPKRMSAIMALSKRHRSVQVGQGEQSEGASKAGPISRLARLRLVPVDGGFSELFQGAAANAKECAEELRKMVVSFDHIDDYYQQIRTFERRGDQITVELLRRLDATFVTPYDRGDIHALAEALDDVVDDMFSAADLIHLLRVDKPLPEVVDLAETLATMASEMVLLIGSISSKEGARQHLERIEAFEREGDATYRRGIARLFSGEYEALDVLKWKDIIQAVENAINQIEDVADVVGSILAKNS
jgi:predicted phosphate transport protein (TIGR00153 family)